VSLLHNMERSFNDIWGVTRPRPLLQRVLIYWGVLTLGPITLGSSLRATAAMRSLAESLAYVPHSVLAFVPLGTTIFILVFLYLAAPNARVRFRAALGGGLVAGMAWELAKYGYTLYAAKSIRYNAIYGSLGAIPLFLLWVYVSWLIVLFGARLAYALQHAAIGSPVDPRVHDARSREILCTRVAIAAAARFLSGDGPVLPRHIARTLATDVAYVSEAVRMLKEAGLLAETGGGGIVPSRPPEQIRLLEIAKAAQGSFFDRPVDLPSKEAATRALFEVFAEADRKGRDVLAGMSLEALARPMVPPASEKKRNPRG